MLLESDVENWHLVGWRVDNIVQNQEITRLIFDLLQTLAVVFNDLVFIFSKAAILEGFIGFGKESERFGDSQIIRSELARYYQPEKQSCLTLSALHTLSNIFTSSHEGLFVWGFDQQSWKREQACSKSACEMDIK